MKNYFSLLRPQQWLKNLFVLAPLFFSGHLFELDRLFPCLLGMIAFSLNASSVYIFNDYRDMDKDKLHPAKRFRPLAAGSVPKNNALILSLSQKADPPVIIICRHGCGVGKTHRFGGWTPNRAVMLG